MGRKKRPFYRIVAVDSRKARDGAYLDNLGFYNPLTDPVELLINEERALHWLQKGAIPSETVRSLLSRKGIMLKWDMMRRGVDAPRMEEELKKWEVLQMEKARRREALVAQKRRAGVAAMAADGAQQQAPAAPPEPAPETPPEAATPAAE